MSELTHYATGRRKTSTARVYLRPGDGQATVNGRPLEEYFGNDVLKMIIRQPLLLTENDEKLDFIATVKGGGTTGQAGAIRHGLARALTSYEPELHKTLRDAGFLTRDSRKKERKKYGLKGARARYQFSKR